MKEVEVEGLNDYIRGRRHWRNVVSNATESCRSGSGGGGVTISERDDTGEMSCPMRQNHSEVEVGGG